MISAFLGTDFPVRLLIGCLPHCIGVILWHAHSHPGQALGGTRVLAATPIAARTPTAALVKGSSPRPHPWASRTWPRTAAGSGPRLHLRCVDLLEELSLLPSTDTDSHARFACRLVGQPVGRVGLGRLAGLGERVVWCYEMIGVGEFEAKGCVICCVEALRPLGHLLPRRQRA